MGQRPVRVCIQIIGQPYTVGHTREVSTKDASMEDAGIEDCGTEE